MLPQAWLEAVERRKAGRVRLDAFAASLTLSKNGARPSPHASITTESAAVLLSSFASWQEQGQVRVTPLSTSTGRMHRDFQHYFKHIRLTHDTLECPFLQRSRFVTI